MMESRILLMLGFAVAATAVLPPGEELSYKEALSVAVGLYNQEPAVTLAFRLLKAKPQPEWDPLLQSRQELEFTMQETTCPPSEQLDPDKCDFKGDGEVRKCSGFIFSEEASPVIELNCETAARGPNRVRRTLVFKVVRIVRKLTRKAIKKLIRRA